MPRFLYDPDADELVPVNDDAQVAEALKKNPKLKDYRSFAQQQGFAPPASMLTPDASKQPKVQGAGDLPPAFQIGNNGGLIPTDSPLRRAAMVGMRGLSHMGTLGAGGALSAATANPLPLGIAGAIAATDTISNWWKDPSNANLAGEAAGTVLGPMAGAIAGKVGASALPRLGKVGINALVGAGLGEGIAGARKLAGDDSEQMLDPTRMALSALISGVPTAMATRKSPPSVNLRKALEGEYGPDFDAKSAKNLNPAARLKPIADQIRTKPEDPTEGMRINLQEEYNKYANRNKDIDVILKGQTAREKAAKVQFSQQKAASVSEAQDAANSVELRMKQLDTKAAQAKAQMDRLKASEKQLTGSALAQNRAEQEALRKQLIDLQTEKELTPKKQRTEVVQNIGEKKKELETNRADAFFKAKGFQRPELAPPAEEVIDRPNDFEQTVAGNGDSDLNARIGSVRPAYTEEQQKTIDRLEGILADPNKPTYAKERARKYLDTLYSQQSAPAEVDSDEKFAQAIQDAIAQRSAQKGTAPQPAVQPAVPEPLSAITAEKKQLAEKATELKQQVSAAKGAQMPAEQGPEPQVPLDVEKAMNSARMQRIMQDMKGLQNPDATIPRGLSHSEWDSYRDLAGKSKNEYELLNNLYTSDPATVRAFAKVHGGSETGNALGAEFIRRSFNPSEGDLSAGPKEWYSRKVGDKLKEAFGPDGEERFKSFQDIYNAMQEVLDKQKKSTGARVMSMMPGGMAKYYMIGRALGGGAQKAAEFAGGVLVAELSAEKLIDLAEKNGKFRQEFLQWSKGPATMQSLAAMPSLVSFLSKHADKVEQKPRYTPEQQKAQDYFDKLK